MSAPPAAAPAPPRTSALPRLGLKAQLIFWWSSLVIVLLTATAAQVYWQRRESLELEVRDKGRFVVRSLSQILVTPLLEGNYTQIQNFVAEQAEAKLVDYLCVQDPRGTILAEAGRVSMRSLEAEVYAAALPARLRYDPIVDQDTFLEGRRFHEYATRITGWGPSAEAIVRAGFDTEVRIDRVVDEDVKNLGIVFLVAVPLGVVLSVVLAYWIARPLRTLEEAAQAIGSGSYDQAIVVHSPRELAVLAHAFDQMRVRIKDQLREIQEAYLRLDRKVYELEVLVEVAKRMNFKSYSPELLSYLLDTGLSALDAEWGSMMMEEGGEGDERFLTVRVVRGAGFDRATGVKLSRGEGIAGQVLATGQPIIANEGSRDPRFAHRPDQAEFDPSIRSLICVPLTVENQPIGVINLVNKRSARGFDENDLTLLTALASQAARSLENAKLYDQAIRESKTGLFVPRYFEARVREELIVSRRYGQTFSVVILDIDFFKKINDTYGHLLGDEVLIKLAQFVRSAMREGIDVASRFGGEEFALLLPKTDKAGALILAERLRRAVEAGMEDKAKGLPKVTVSIGVASYPDDGDDKESLFRRADDALYTAKRSGRNQVRAAGKDT